MFLQRGWLLGPRAWLAGTAHTSCHNEWHYQINIRIFARLDVSRANRVVTKVRSVGVSGYYHRNIRYRPNLEEKIGRNLLCSCRGEFLLSEKTHILADRSGFRVNLRLILIVSLCFLPLAMTGCTSPRKVRPGEPYVGPQPLLTCIERNPWKTALGSDTPYFALYDDGQVIYLHRTREGQHVYVTTKISSDQLKALLKDFELTDDFYDLEDEYVVVLGTGQPKTVFYLSDGKRSKLVTVYGPVWDRYTHRLADVERWRGPDKLPPGLARLCVKTREYRNDEATLWVPKYLEILVRRNVFGRLPSDWPQRWPRIEDEMVWNHGDLTSVFVSGVELEKAQDYAQQHAEVFRTGLGAWVSTIRYVFPNEPSWTDREWGIAKEKKPAVQEKLKSVVVTDQPIPKTVKKIKSSKPSFPRSTADNKRTKPRETTVRSSKKTASPSKYRPARPNDWSLSNLGSPTKTRKRSSTPTVGEGEDEEKVEPQPRPRRRKQKKKSRRIRARDDRDQSEEYRRQPFQPDVRRDHDIPVLEIND